jgi:hypothetical protein
MHPVVPLPPAERQRAVALAHHLCHCDGLTVRAAQKVMREQYALVRSLGSIAHDLRAFTCARCRDTPVDGPAERDRRVRWVSPVPPPEHVAHAVRWGGRP